MATKRRAQNREVDLEEKVRSGPDGAYEALQLFRSRAIRLKSKNDHKGSVAVTVQGAKSLLTNGYGNAGAELAMYLVDLLNELFKEMDPSLRQSINDVDAAFEPNSPHRVEFLKGCVKWSMKNGSRELGDLTLHVTLGRCLWDNGDRSASVYQFAAGEAPETFCQRLWDSFPADADQATREQALTLGVLHFLALENLRDANELMSCYRRAQKVRGLSGESDLTNFCKYLLLTCRRDAQPLFKTLVNTYARALDFDETAPALLTGPIGQKFFGIQPKANPMMSMLHQMLA